MSEPNAKKGFVKGNLSEVVFPKVLNFVHVANKTGVLAITRESKKVHIHFLNGKIVYATSTYFPGLSLGDFLMREGKISRQTHEKSLEAIRETKQKQGTYLVEKGKLSPHDLYEILNRQVLAKLFWLFEWEDGDFYFKETEIAEEELRLIKVEIPKLIYQGIRDHMALNSLPTEFKGRKESMLLRNDDLPFNLNVLGMGPVDTRIFSLVNGRFTLRQVVAMAKLKKRAIYKVLYGLFLTGVIGFPESVKARKKKEPVLSAKTEKDDKGYEISIADDILAEAMASVDKIHEKVKSETPAQAAQSAQPEVMDFQTPQQNEPPTVPNPEAQENNEFDFNPGESIEPEPEPEPETVEEDQAPTDDFGFQMEDDDSGSTEESEGSSFDFGAEEKTEDSGDAFGFEQTDSDQDSDANQSEDVGFDLGLADDDQGRMDDSPDFSESAAADDNGFEQDFEVDINDFSSPDEMKKQGMMFIEDGRFQEAERFLSKTAELMPDDPSISAYLGWAMYKADLSGDWQNAEQVIKQGMKEGGVTYLHFLFLGKIYFEEEQYEFAELHFVKALEMNVDCTEAKEMIKAIHNK